MVGNPNIYGSSRNRTLFTGKYGKYAYQAKAGLTILAILGVIVGSAFAVAHLFYRLSDQPSTGAIKLEGQKGARIVAVSGDVKRKRGKFNQGLETINKANLHLPLMQEDVIKTYGNDSYIVFALDENTKFRLKGDNGSLIFEKFDRKGEILFILEDGLLNSNVDKKKGYNIKIISKGMEYLITGTGFSLNATGGSSRMSVSEGSVKVGRLGSSRLNLEKIIEAGREIQNIAGEFGEVNKITDLNRLKTDPLLLKTQDELELEIEQEHQQNLVDWEKTITGILYSWADTSIMDPDTQKSSLYSNAPGYTTEVITLYMGAYVGREHGSAAKIRFIDLPDLRASNLWEFTFSPQPGDRIYEKILDQLFVVSEVREAELLLIDKKSSTADLFERIGQLSKKTKTIEAESEKTEKIKETTDKTVDFDPIENEDMVSFGISSEEDKVRVSVFEGYLTMHDESASKEEEVYSVPAGTSYSYWIHPGPNVPTFHPGDLNFDELMAYTSMKQEFWNADFQMPERVELSRKANTDNGSRIVDSGIDALDLDLESLLAESTTRGLDIEFAMEGTIAVTNFDMMVTFKRQDGPTLIKRLYPCFMFFMRTPGTNGKESIHWKAFLGGYRTFTSGGY